ncbi:MAG TPA: hypothetical protein DEA08_30285 [Planctomycetes bacterium]|nr:hypothetical protein [Planctomycetota bacterium]
MRTTSSKTGALRASALCLALLGAGAVGATSFGLSQAWGGGDRGQIKEVRESSGEGVSVLLAVPKGQKVRPGQSLEVVRDGKTVGYGSIEQVFSEVAVATIGTIVGDPPQIGDEVRFLDGFHRNGHKKPASPALPRGSVVSVRDGLVLLDFGKRAGLRLGHEVLLRDKESRAELGRIAVELLGDTSGGGVIIKGKAVAGAEAVAIGFAKPKGGIDFVQLNLLGAVAELDNPYGYGRQNLGVKVRRILPGSPAQRARIQRGDRILAVDRTVVRDIAAVRERIEARKDHKVEVMVVRGDQILMLFVDFTP